MTGWIDLVNSLDADADTLCDDLAVVHCRFEQIHPFLDDGRVEFALRQRTSDSTWATRHSPARRNHCGARTCATRRRRWR